ncbi:MAG: hypothetical protein ACI92G_001642, partial [Candidatus Pelagisphaera sp.]
LLGPLGAGVAANAGIMLSSAGKARHTPALFRKVRRDKCLEKLKCTRFIGKGCDGEVLNL